MKIEKLNEHQLRCILTGKDMEERNLKINELVMGTERTKRLFKEIMEVASKEHGFDTEGLALMVEAIPVNSERIVLIITKAESPEELAEHFSDFKPPLYEDTIAEDEYGDEIEAGVEDAQNMGDDLFGELQGDEETPEAVLPSKTENVGVREIKRIFSFSNIIDVMNFAEVLGNCYHGRNDLYKNGILSRFFLVLSQGSHAVEEFNKICNVLSEFGLAEKYSLEKEAYLKEHCKCLISEEAINKLVLSEDNQ